MSWFTDAIDIMDKAIAEYGKTNPEWASGVRDAKMTIMAKYIEATERDNVTYTNYPNAKDMK